MSEKFSIEFMRRVAAFVFSLAALNFLIHAAGFHVFDFTELLIKSPLAVSELISFLASSPNYLQVLPQFSEFVVIQFGFVAVSAAVFGALLCRRLARLLGINQFRVIESKGLLFAFLFFFWIGLHPYILGWPTGDEKDNLLVLSVYLQMFVQAALWAMSTLFAIGCLLVPERMNAATKKPNVSN